VSAAAAPNEFVASLTPAPLDETHAHMRTAGLPIRPEPRTYHRLRPLWDDTYHPRPYGTNLVSSTLRANDAGKRLLLAALW
jgi:hypothetical protein